MFRARGFALDSVTIGRANWARDFFRDLGRGENSLVMRKYLFLLRNDLGNENKQLGLDSKTIIAILTMASCDVR